MEGRRKISFMLAVLAVVVCYTRGSFYNHEPRDVTYYTSSCPSNWCGERWWVRNVREAVAQLNGWASGVIMGTHCLSETIGCGVARIVYVWWILWWLAAARN